MPTLDRLAYGTLILLLLGIRAAANGTPPPPLWINGWYDGASFDDATESFFRIKSLAPESSAFLTGRGALLGRPRLLPAACLVVLASILPPGPAFRLPHLRAPPLS